MVVPSGLPVGSGLGLAVARRFGREGFGVALVARNRGKVDGIVGSLAGEASRLRDSPRI